jgi:hypothetical protein
MAGAAADIWYADESYEAQGPVDHAGLVQAWRDGRVHADRSYVWWEGRDGGWVHLTSAEAKERVGDITSAGATGASPRKQQPATAEEQRQEGSTAGVQLDDGGGGGSRQQQRIPKRRKLGATQSTSPAARSSGCIDLSDVAESGDGDCVDLAGAGTRNEAADTSLVCTTCGRTGHAFHTCVVLQRRLANNECACISCGSTNHRAAECGVHVVAGAQGGPPPGQATGRWPQEVADWGAQRGDGTSAAAAAAAAAASHWRRQVEVVKLSSEVLPMPRDPADHEALQRASQWLEAHLLNKGGGRIDAISEVKACGLGGGLWRCVLTLARPADVVRAVGRHLRVDNGCAGRPGKICVYNVRPDGQTFSAAVSSREGVGGAAAGGTDDPRTGTASYYHRSAPCAQQQQPRQWGPDPSMSAAEPPWRRQQWPEPYGGGGGGVPLRCTACGKLGHTFHECVVLQQRLAQQAEASGGAAPAASCGVGAAGVGTSGSEQQPIVL